MIRVQLQARVPLTRDTTVSLDYDLCVSMQVHFNIYFTRNFDPLNNLYVAYEVIKLLSCRGGLM